MDLQEYTARAQYGDLTIVYPRPYSIYLRGTINPKQRPLRFHFFGILWRHYGSTLGLRVWGGAAEKAIPLNCEGGKGTCLAIFYMGDMGVSQN